MVILTGTHESPMYRDNSDEATALHQIIAARRLLLHAAGPCHRGDGSAAEHPLSYTQSLEWVRPVIVFHAEIGRETKS